MIKRLFSFVFDKHVIRCLALFSFALLLIYYWLLHGLVTQWLLSKDEQQQLKTQWLQLNSKIDPNNPLQHDPLIHHLIKLAKEHELELITTKFSATQHLAEEFSCETAGSYLNTIAFIKALLDSNYILHLRELNMRNQQNISLIHTRLVVKHDL